MSSRNIRKLFGTTTLPPPSQSSDEEYEPLYMKNSVESKFKGLVLSSDSWESDTAEQETTDVEEKKVSKPKFLPKSRKNNKKRRKGKHKHAKQNRVEEVDEIDKCVKEVNDMLGEPPLPTQAKPVDPGIALMTVSSKHLNYENELRRLFGPEDAEDGKRQKKNNRPRLCKATIVPIPAKGLSYPCKGLSMSLQKTEGNRNYYTFNHSMDYQNRIRVILNRSTMPGETVANMTEARMKFNNLTVEGILENADLLLQYEEYTEANKSIEQCILTLQAMAHPSFSLTDMRNRLEYKYLENRVFHVAVLKYLHMLTNKACHRTALELAKLLLNLDPSDPLALVFIVDMLAIRAREHRWLIDIVDYWSKKRDAGFLFNIQYSYAMAHFHVATKNKEELTQANELIQSAMLAYPSVVVNILECTNTPNAQIQSHELFTTFTEPTMVRGLKVLIKIYAKFTWSRWREVPVMNWLVKNALEVMEKFDKDPSVKERAKRLANNRLALFRKLPVEMIRHFCVIKPMSDLILDGEVPNFSRTISANPAPELVDSIDRYNYNSELEEPMINSATMLLASFITSMLPRNDFIHDPDEREIIDNYRVHLPGGGNINPNAQSIHIELEGLSPFGAAGSASRLARANGSNADSDDSDDEIPPGRLTVQVPVGMLQGSEFGNLLLSQYMDGDSYQSTFDYYDPDFDE